MKTRQKKVYPASRAYEEGLDERLKNPQYAVEYLNTLLEENDSDLQCVAIRIPPKALAGTYRL